MIGRDKQARTAHRTAAEQLPGRVASLVTADQQAVTRRRAAHQSTERRQRDRAIDHHLGLDNTRTRERGLERDQGYDLSL